MSEANSGVDKGPITKGQPPIERRKQPEVLGYKVKIEVIHPQARHDNASRNYNTESIYEQTTDATLDVSAVIAVINGLIHPAE